MSWSCARSSMLEDVPVVLPLDIVRLVSESLAGIGIGVLVEGFTLVLELLARLLAISLADVLSGFVNPLVGVVVKLLLKE